MGKKIKEYKVIIKDDKIALTDNNGTNLFEALAEAEKAQKFYHLLGKFGLIIMAVMIGLVFFSSLSHIFTIGGSVVAGLVALFSWLCADDEKTRADNRKKDINLAHEQLEEAILEAKIRLINQKKAMAQSLAEDRLDFKFAGQTKARTLEEQILEVEYER